MIKLADLVIAVPVMLIIMTLMLGLGEIGTAALDHLWAIAQK